MLPPLPLDAHDVWTTANLLMDTTVCAFIGLRLAPPRAARLVEEQAGGVYERHLAPRLEAQLEQSREAILAEVREIVAEHGDGLLKRFDDVRAQARADAEAQIAAARAQLEEQAKAMQAQAEEQAARVLEEARSEAARYLGGRSAEARATQAVVESQNEIALGTWLLQALGGNEMLAGRVVKWVRDNHPNAWKNAVKFPDQAGAILSPLLGLAQRNVAASYGGDAARRPESGSGW